MQNPLPDALNGLSEPEIAAIQALPANRKPGIPVADWTTTDVAFAWTQSRDLPFVPLSAQRVDDAAYPAFWRHCRQHGWLPLFVSPDVAAVVTPRPHSPQLRRAIAKLLRSEIHLAGCTEDDFDRTLSDLGIPQQPEVLPPPVIVPSAWRLAPQENAPDPYRRGVLEVLQTAYLLGASDVFLDDESGRIAVRFRLSGVAEVFPPIPARNRATFLGALKRLAAVNPNARSEFHDARFSVEFPPGIRVDIRAAFAPTLAGETVALRLQDSRRMIAGGAKVPLPAGMLEKFSGALAKKGGMVLVTGPTGSGKTTTLYASLLSMDRADLVIRTIEDPVEYTLPGITQVPVGGDTGRTFGGALRSFLRLNPDVILVGEIRDEETVKLAVEAGLTGHTLLSTLHAPDCVSTITRLLSLVEDAGTRDSFRVALKATLSAILSQRLASRLCQDCKDPRPLLSDEADLFRRFDLPAPATVFCRRGCPRCGTGLRGRVPVFELLVASPRLLDVMTEGTTFASEAFRRQWLAEGGEPLGRYALRLVAEGIIEFDEAKKLTVWVPEHPTIQ